MVAIPRCMVSDLFKVLLIACFKPQSVEEVAVAVALLPKQTKLVFHCSRHLSNVLVVDSGQRLKWRVDYCAVGSCN